MCWWPRQHSTSVRLIRHASYVYGACRSLLANLRRLVSLFCRWRNSTKRPTSDVIYFSHANSATRKNGTVFRSVDGGRRWAAVLQVTDDSAAADASFAYNALTTLQDNGQMTTLGLLYETGDAEKCTRGTFSCIIAFKTLKIGVQDDVEPELRFDHDNGLYRP